MDALHEMMDHEQIARYREQDLIEVIPLAYMRGRTLNEAFIILDELQNTTVSQMKMFLTRMGHGSKIVASGDTTQIDLPEHAKSGLVDAIDRLQGIEGVACPNLARATSFATRWSRRSSTPTNMVLPSGNPPLPDGRRNTPDRFLWPMAVNDVHDPNA